MSKLLSMNVLFFQLLFSRKQMLQLILLRLLDPLFVVIIRTPCLILFRMCRGRMQSLFVFNEIGNLIKKIYLKNTVIFPKRCKEERNGLIMATCIPCFCQKTTSLCRSLLINNNIIILINLITFGLAFDWRMTRRGGVTWRTTYHFS